jgi:hypothetical protein
MQESEDVQRVITILTRTFTTEWKWKNAPHGMWKALKIVPDLQPGHIQRTLLSVGFKAWLSHFLAGQRKKTHYRGHTDHIFALNKLETLDYELQRGVASVVEKAKVHPTVSAAITVLKARIVESGKYAGRRCRTTPDRDFSFGNGCPEPQRIST